MRNLAISFTPVVFFDYALWQVLWIDAVILVTLAATARLLPWRTLNTSLCELSSSFGLATFMQVTALFIDTNDNWAEPIRESSRWSAFLHSTWKLSGHSVPSRRMTRCQTSLQVPWCSLVSLLLLVSWFFWQRQFGKEHNEMLVSSSTWVVFFLWYSVSQCV